MAAEEGSPHSQGTAESQGSQAGDPAGSQETVAPTVRAAVANADATDVTADRICALLDPVFGGSAAEAMNVSNPRALRPVELLKVLSAAEPGGKRVTPLLAQRFSAILKHIGGGDLGAIGVFAAIAEIIVTATEHAEDVLTLVNHDVVKELGVAWVRVGAQWASVQDRDHKLASEVAKLFERLVFCARRLVVNADGDAKAKVRDAMTLPIMRTVTNAALSVGSRRVASEALFDVFDLQSTTAALKEITASLKPLGQSFASAGDFLMQGNLTEFVASLIRSDLIKLSEGGRQFCAGISPAQDSDVFEKFAVIVNTEHSGGQLMELARPFINFANSVSKPRSVHSFLTEMKVLSTNEEKCPHVTLGTVWLDIGKEFLTAISASAQHEMRGQPAGEKENIALCMPFSDFQEMIGNKTTVTLKRDQPVTALGLSALLNPEFHYNITVSFKPDEHARATALISAGLRQEDVHSSPDPEPPAAKNDAPPKPKPSPSPSKNKPLAADAKGEAKAAAAKPKAPAPKKRKGEGKGKAKGKRKGKGQREKADDEEPAAEPPVQNEVQTAETAKPSPAAPPAAEATKVKESAKAALLQPKTQPDGPSPRPGAGAASAPNGILQSAKPAKEVVPPKQSTKRKHAEAQPPKAVAKLPAPPNPVTPAAAAKPTVPGAAAGRTTRSKGGAAAAAAAVPTEPPIIAPPVHIERDVVPESPPADANEPAAAKEAEEQSEEPPNKKQKAASEKAVAKPKTPAKAAPKPPAKVAAKHEAPKAKGKELRKAKEPTAELSIGAGSDDDLAAAEPPADAENETDVLDADEEGAPDADDADDMKALVTQLKRAGASRVDKKRKHFDAMQIKTFEKIESALKDHFASLNAERTRAQKHFQQEWKALQTEYGAVLEHSKAIAQTVTAQLTELERAEQKLKTRATALAATDAFGYPISSDPKVKAAVAQSKQMMSGMGDALFAIAKDEQRAKLAQTLRLLL